MAVADLSLAGAWAEIRRLHETRSAARSVLRARLAGSSSYLNSPYGEDVSRTASDAAWHDAADVKLRNAHLAFVDSSKVLDYLLNDAHPDNGGKARFFESLGFSREDPERFIRALRYVAEHGEVVKSESSVHGEKYIVDGWLSAHTQERRQWPVRAVWIIDHGGDAPRLVTAYPGKE